MAVGDLFMTTTTEAAPLSGSVADPGDKVGESTATSVSDFVTTQSLANFSAITGAITVAWKALQQLDASLSALWVPFAFAGAFAIVSLVSSWDGLKKEGERRAGAVMSATFIAIINGLVLASAVVGAETATDAATEDSGG